jgi:hypothetical protein
MRGCSPPLESWLRLSMLKLPANCPKLRLECSTPHDIDWNALRFHMERDSEAVTAIPRFESLQKTRGNCMYTSAS